MADNTPSIPVATESIPLTTENWWDMVPGRKEGGAKLLKRCIELLAWRVDFAMNVLLGYKDFLECKVACNDWYGNMLEPPIPVYQMWSQHIMDTQNYFQDMTLLYGQVVHYNPSLYKDFEGRNARISNTMQLIHEKYMGGFLDPMVWHYGPPMPFHPPAPPPPLQAQAKEPPITDSNKRPRSDPHTYGGVPTVVAGHHTRFSASLPSKTVKSAAAAGLVTLCIFRVMDAGAMDNKVTLDRNLPLKTVLDYYRFRCMWRNGLRLDLNRTQNELKMDRVENIVLTSIHIDELVTLVFKDWKGETHPRQIKMRDTIKFAFENVARSLGVENPSTLTYTHKGLHVEPNSTPMNSRLDNGDVLDVALPNNVAVQQQYHEANGEEKKDNMKDETV